MLKKLMIVVCCLCMAGNVLGIDEHTRYFLKFGDEKIAITRKGFERSELFKTILDEQESDVFNKEKNEVVVPLFHFPAKLHPSIGDIKRFVQVCDGTLIIKKIDVVQLPLLVTLALYYDTDFFAEFKKELFEKIKYSELWNKDYREFLQGQGLLWNLVTNLPGLIVNEVKKSWVSGPQTLVAFDSGLSVDVQDSRLASRDADNKMRDMFFDLNVEQLIVWISLSKVAVQFSEKIAQLKNDISYKLSYEEIFAHKTILDLFASLPVQRIQQLVEFKGFEIVRVAVKRLLDEIEKEIAGKQLSQLEIRSVEQRLQKIGAMLELLKLTSELKIKDPLFKQYTNMVDIVAMVAATFTKQKALDNNKKNEKCEFEDDVD